MKKNERGPLRPLKTIKNRVGNFSKIPDLGLTAEDLSATITVDPDALVNELKDLEKEARRAGLTRNRHRRKY